MDTNPSGATGNEFGLTEEELNNLGTELGDDVEPDVPPADPVSAPVTGSAPTDPAAGSSTAAPSTPVGQPQSAQAPAPPQAAAVPDASPPTTEAPFTFRNDLTFPGAVKMADGSLRLPADKVQSFERVLLNERALQRRTGELQRQLAEKAEASSANNAQATALTTELTRIMSLPDNPGDVPGTAKVQAFLELSEKLPQYLAKAEADYWKRRAETTGQQASSVTEAQEWAAVEPTFWANFEDALDQVFQQPDYAVLAGSKAQVLAELKRIGVEEKAVYRDPDGSFKFRLDVFKAELDRAAKFEKRLQAERSQWEQKHAVSQRNAAVLGNGTQAPPQVPVKGAVPVAQPGAGAQPKNLNEYRDRLRRLQEEPI